VLCVTEIALVYGSKEHIRAFNGFYNTQTTLLKLKGNSFFRCCFAIHVCSALPPQNDTFDFQTDMCWL